MTPPPVRASSATRRSWKQTIAWLALFWLCLSITQLVIFRPFFLSHFDAILSDPGDGRFEISMMEHWSNSLHGREPVASPPFFYPEKGVLGYSDALLLIGVLYTGVKALGFDRYLAFQFMMMIMTACGFALMYYLLWKVVRVRRWLALAGATLFTVSNMYAIDLVHVHLNVAVLVPGFFLLLAGYWRDRERRHLSSVLWLSGAALYLSVLFYTSFYIGWYLGFSLAVMCLFLLALQALTERSSRPIAQAARWLWDDRLYLLSAAAVFAVSMVPFLLLYLPVLHHTGKRDMGEMLYYLPRVPGIFDVGQYNVVWGGISSRIETYMGGIHEHPTGWPYFTIALFLACSVYCFLQLRRSAEERVGSERNTFLIMSAIALTCLTVWLFGVKFGEHHTFWKVLWKFVPGAAAIRVPQRINLVLNVGVVVVSLFVLDRLVGTARASRKLLYGGMAVLLAVLFVEQITLMPTHIIHRSEEARKFARIGPPPPACSDFFVSNWSDTQLGMGVKQMDGMLVAEQYRIPTLNGYSSWFPEGWNLIWSTKGHVIEDAVIWSKAHNVSGLCALNMGTGLWSTIDVAGTDLSTFLGKPIVGAFTDPGFEDDGLGPWQPWLQAHGGVNGEHPHEGAHSLAETDGAGSYYQDAMGLTPGKTYRVTAWVSAAPGATAGTQIAIYDPGANVATFSPVMHPGTGWQLQSHSVKVSQAGTVRVHLFRVEGSGTVYWDDVKIYEGPETPDAPAENH